MYVATPAQTENRINYISLFSGCGGLDLAVKIALPNSRCVCYVENEITAVEILAARIAGGSLDDAPVWSDVKSFPAEWFAGGLVGGIIGGFPCTDISVAGKQAGISRGKKSGLWREYAKIIRQVQPNWVFIENVPGLLSAANGGVVLGQLTQMGFNAEWGTLSAGEVGASHRRRRVFVLAYQPGVGWGEGWAESEGVEGGFDVGVEGGTVVNPKRTQWGKDINPRTSQKQGEDGEGEKAGGVGERSEVVGDPHQRNDNRAGNPRERRRGEPTNHGGELGHPLSPRLEERGCQPGDIGEEHQTVNRTGSELGLFAPGPNDPYWNSVLVQSPWLRPSISQAEIKFLVRRLVDGLAHRPLNEVEYRDDKKCGPKDGTEKDSGTAALRELRRNQQETPTTSYGLRSTTKGENFMSQVPQKSGSGNRSTAQGSNQNMCGMPVPVSTYSQQARHALWFIEVQNHLRRISGKKEMGTAEQDQVLRSLWSRVSIQEAKRENLLFYLRDQAVSDLPELSLRAWASRPDALRATGNGVVAVQGAAMFRELMGRAIRAIKQREGGGEIEP